MEMKDFSLVAESVDPEKFASQILFDCATEAVPVMENLQTLTIKMRSSNFKFLHRSAEKILRCDSQKDLNLEFNKIRQDTAVLNDLCAEHDPEVISEAQAIIHGLQNFFKQQAKEVGPANPFEFVVLSHMTKLLENFADNICDFEKFYAFSKTWINSFNSAKAGKRLRPVVYPV